MSSMRPLETDDCNGSGNILCLECMGLIIHACPCPDSRVRMCKCPGPRTAMTSAGDLIELTTSEIGENSHGTV